MTRIYRPLSEVDRSRIAAAFRARITSIDDFAARRRALELGAPSCEALRTIASGEPSFEATFVERIAPAWSAAVLSLVETEPVIELHTCGVAQVSSWARAELSPWVAHLLLGTLPALGSDHPSLDGSALLDRREPYAAAKLRAMLSYFERVGSEPPRGRFEIERVVVAPRRAEDWGGDDSALGAFDVDEAGTIEDAHGHRQADFANAYLGGGVLRAGAVQEEIRLSVSTELLFGLIVSPRMADEEAIVLRGSERFARTDGYAFSLRFAGPLRDDVQRRDDGTPDSEVVAMDAIAFGDRDLRRQLVAPALLRELNKARAAFRADTRGWPIATGNWGCGAFQGDPGIKAVVQWLAASSEGRAIRYCPFGDPRVTTLASFVEHARARFATVGQLFGALMSLAPDDPAAVLPRLLRI